MSTPLVFSSEFKPPSQDLRDKFLKGSEVGPEELEGVSLDVADGTGRTMLSISCREGHVGHVYRLLQMGSNPNQLRPNGECLVITSTRQGHLEVVRTLVGFGAEVDVAMVEGWTALLISATKGHDVLTEYLLDEGADINHRMEGGATALLIASSKGFLKVVDVLIRRGANVNIPMYGGATPLLVAAQSDHPDTCRMLVEAGADTEKMMDNGGGPLYIAAQNGFKTTVMELLECGANVDATTSGFKAAAIAVRREHHDVAMMLDRVSAFKEQCQKDEYSGVRQMVIQGTVPAPVMQWVPGMKRKRLEDELAEVLADETACYSAFFHGASVGDTVHRLTEYDGPISAMLMEYLVQPNESRARVKFVAKCLREGAGIEKSAVKYWA